jgi:O-antigen/teichoic acid export membrane protein
VGTSVVLLLGSIGPILINNASVPWLSGQGAAAVTVGAFSGALTLSRVPIQLGSALFGPLLNRVAHAVETSDAVLERRLNRRGTIFASSVGAAFALGFSTAGPPALELFLGSDYGLERRVFAMLGLSSALMLVCVVVQVRIAARERWRQIGSSWLAAAFVFVVALVVPGDLVTRATTAPVVASATALMALAYFSRTDVALDARR